MKLRRHHLLLVLSAVFVPACIQTCESASSDTILTNGVGAALRARSDGQSTEISSELKVGGTFSNVYLDLVGDDSLNVTRGKTTEKLVRRTAPFGMVSYVSTLPGDSAGKELVFSFLRKVDKGAPASKVIMPPAFEITSPKANSSFSRAEDPIAITWSKSGAPDPMVVVLSGTCIREISRTVEVDTGSFSLPPGSLVDPNAGMEPMQPVVTPGRPQGEAPAALPKAKKSCKVTVSLSRTRSGKIDPGYGQGGTITATQARKVTFNSLP